MKRKQYASTHEEALDRMCYVCGELIPDKMLRHDVVKNLDTLGSKIRGGARLLIFGKSSHPPAPYLDPPAY